MINKYIDDDKITSNNNNINLSIFKNNQNNNLNNINNNNISYFSNISNINNIQENQKQLIIDIPGKLDNKEMKDIKDLKIFKDLNKKMNDEKDIICKTNINPNNNNIINGINNLDNENKSRLITYESPIKTGLNNNNNNNNTSALDTSILNTKLDQQIKLINEKSENNRIEEEKNQLKLKEIESSLQLEERLKHENREIKKMP